MLFLSSAKACVVARFVLLARALPAPPAPRVGYVWDGSIDQSAPRINIDTRSQVLMRLNAI